uniref:Uncharacterized protein n=1 Tax=viral metagenome TaxID=1070528 RepID=A0A6C0BH67_9ZZZZ
MKGEKILNPDTGRMVLKSGAIGKKLVAEQAARAPSARNRNLTTIWHPFSRKKP